MLASLLPALVLASWPLALVAAPAVTSDHFKVDQFGWLPAEAKVALVGEPVVGFNAPDPFTPGPSLEIRRWSDDAVVFSAAPTRWNGGATQAQSGDRVWRLDFSSLTTP